MNIDEYRNIRGQIWVNVASSIYVLENFVNIDNHIFLAFVNFYPNIRWIVPRKYWDYFEKYCEARSRTLLVKRDCRKPLFFPDNSVDHILCSHFLEHVFPFEMEKIVRDYYRALKPGGTVHLIVPDLHKHVERYLKKRAEGIPGAADEFVKETLLSRESRGSFKYRIMEFIGAFGLQHRWMYDQNSLSQKLIDNGFQILEKNETPSQDYRLNDGSVHIVARKL
jgi:predicted SAM-dependent methyltransferase